MTFLNLFTSLLIVANLPTLQIEPEVTPESYVTGLENKNACGPIACYVSLAAMNCNTDLKEVITEMSWEPGQKIEFSKLKNYLAQKEGIVASAQRLSPTTLLELASNEDTVVIIAIRRNSNEINHAACVVGGKGDQISTVEYPQIMNQIPIAELVEIWDGEAIVVRHAPTSISYLNSVLFLLPSLLIFLIVKGIFNV